MTDKEQQKAAKKFAADWKDKGYEKGQSQPFWLALLRDVCGVEYLSDCSIRIFSRRLADAINLQAPGKNYHGT